MKDSPRPEQPFFPHRFIGKIILAFGFVLALYAVTEHTPVVLNVSLGVLVTGIAMLAAGLYREIRLRKEK
jgi:hypothetical protein